MLNDGIKIVSLIVVHKCIIGSPESVMKDDLQVNISAYLFTRFLIALLQIKSVSFGK